MGSKNGVDRKMDKSKSRTDLLAAGKKKVISISFLSSFCVFLGELAPPLVFGFFFFWISVSIIVR